MNRPFIRPPDPLRSFLLALMLPAIMVGFILWIDAEYDRGQSVRLSVVQSYARYGALIETHSDVLAAETSQRGYVITGDREFLLQYAQRRASAENKLSELTRLYRDTPSDPAAIAALRRVAEAKFAEMQTVIDRYMAGGGDAARARVANGVGKRLMTRFQQQMDHLIEREEQRRSAGAAAYADRIRSLQRLMWGLFALATIGSAIVSIALWRQRQARYLIELQQYEAARRNETILDSTVDPIVIVNPSGTVETINKAATLMLGYDPASLARRDFSVISDIATGAGSFHDRIGLVGGRLRRSYWTDRQVRHRDGRWISVDIALGVMSLPDGDHIVVALRDINDRQRTERMKDELISTVSHELRTPLTSIVGALGLLRLDAKALPEEAASLVAIAENNAERLIRLVNDMLDVDRMDSGKLRLTMQSIDLRTVAMRACEDNSSLARTRGVTIDHQVPDDAMMVQGDEERLIQVVTNLLSNAVKVSAAGDHVTVSVGRSGDSRRAILHVDDQGPGIPPEFRSRIFGRFERAANDEGMAGTGLGLAITREIVGQHGGDIHFEDLAAGGTRFVVSLPVTCPVAVADDIAGEASVLICESDPDIARALQSQLSQDGYTCRIVTSARAARAAIAANGFSLLLLDMTLDDGDAFELAREARRLASPDRLSILMVSAANADLTAPLSLDLVDWIEKPIDPARLQVAMRAALRRSSIDQPTVLHLDDDQDTLEITATALRGEAHILRATTLSEARALLRLHRPHLAILDVHLEKGTGLDLLPDLVDETGLAIPTVIYSAHDVNVALSGQIGAILVKSRTSLPDLKATVRRVVTSRHMTGGEG